MCPRDRPLHILVIAPVAALSAVFLGASPHAVAAAATAPTPIVIAIDAGHGGHPDPANPTTPFDPGAVGANGVLEKDVALDVAKRLAALLRDDLVDPVLTRTTDIWLSIPQREQVAIQSNATEFVSIHCNSFTDPAPEGTLVLYPNSAAEPFAQSLSDSLARALTGDAVGDRGVQLRDNWWIHAPMPTATVETAFLSNPHDAALLATASFRQSIAMAIRDGIEAYNPMIATRKAELLAWQRAHPLAPPRSAPVHGHAVAARSRVAAAPGTATAWVVFLLLLAVAVRWPGRAMRVVAAAGRVTATVTHSDVVRHAVARRRRRRLLRGASSRRARHRAPHSVYDELRF